MLTPVRHTFCAALGVALLLAAGLAAGCAGGSVKPPTGTPEPDKFLFDRGNEALDKRKWLVSREYFRELIDTYPQTPHRADAKLGIGDTYLGEGSAESYVLALNEFREFLAFYPTHARAGYAQYKLGMTHFRQMHSADRDQTETREAIKEFTTFVERYPTDELIEDGKAKLREARDRLSQYEYNVGYHYYRSRWFPGAVDRFKRCSRRTRSSPAAIRSISTSASATPRPDSRRRPCPTSIGSSRSSSRASTWSRRRNASSC